MRKGFTLVELAIVLVIIGLLIGGILVARSMIATAKVEMLIKTLQQYEIAVNNFKLNYQSYPGNSKYFTPAGSGNNVFNTNCPYEEFQVFAHLVQAGMLKGNYIAYTPVACGGAENNNYDDPSLIGVNAPYTQFDSPSLEHGSKQPFFGVKSGANSNFAFAFWPRAMDVIPLEAKLNYAPYNGDYDAVALPQSEVGLYDPTTNAADLCYDGAGLANEVLCTDPTAVYGFLYDYMAPI